MAPGRLPRIRWPLFRVRVGRMLGARVGVGPGLDARFCFAGRRDLPARFRGKGVPACRRLLARCVLTPLSFCWGLPTGASRAAPVGSITSTAGEAAVSSAAPVIIAGVGEGEAAVPGIVPRIEFQLRAVSAARDRPTPGPQPHRECVPSLSFRNVDHVAPLFCAARTFEQHFPTSQSTIRPPFASRLLPPAPFPR